MQEARRHGQYGAGFVVYVSVKQARRLVDGYDIVVGDAGRDKAGIALTEDDALPRGAYLDKTVAFETHGDDKRVILQEVAVERCVKLHHTDIEERGVYAMIRTSFVVIIYCAVLVLNLKVKGFGSQGGMQLAGLAVHAHTVIVKDAVCHVARLLNFCKQDAATDSMDTTGREIEDIALADLMACEGVAYRAVSHHAYIFLTREFAFETGIKEGAWLGVYDIPHLRLAVLAVMTTRHGIVGVDLNGEVAVSVYELHQQWQGIAITLRNTGTKRFFRKLLYDFGKGLALPPSVGYDRK